MVKNIVKTILKCISFFVIWSLLIGVVIPKISEPSIWRFFAELIPLGLLVVISLIYMKFIDKEIYDLKNKR